MDTARLRSLAQKLLALLISSLSLSPTLISAQEAPPPGATTIAGIEQLPGWQSCDTCSGGGKVPYSMTPALDYPQPRSAGFPSDTALHGCTLCGGSAWETIPIFPILC